MSRLCCKRVSLTCVRPSFVWPLTQMCQPILMHAKVSRLPCHASGMLWGHLLACLSCLSPVFSFLLSQLVPSNSLLFSILESCSMCVHVCVCARALKSECECVGELGAAVSGNSLRRRSVSFSQTHTHIKKKQHHLEHACTSAHTLALGAYLLLLCLSVSRFPRLSPPIPPPTLTHTKAHRHLSTPTHTNTQTFISLSV